MSLTVFQKGLVLVALPLVFQLAFVLAIARFQLDHAEAEYWSGHTKDVIARAHQIHTHLNDARAGVQGYLITAESKFAAPYHRARAALPGDFDELHAALRDNPGQGEQAHKVHATATAMVDWLSGVEGLVHGGARDEAIARVRSGVGYSLMEDFRREFATFLAEEESLDRVRQAALVRSRGRLNALFVAGGVTAVACTLGLAYAFRRGIARRFAALEANARQLAAGQALPPPLGGDDEIARLDRAFRAMATELTRASDAVRDLYDNAPCGYHSVDAAGTLLAVNRTELQWLGYGAADLVGRVRFADLVTPAGRDAYWKGFDRVKEFGTVGGIELELMRKDGTTLPVLVSSSSVRDPDGGYLRSRTTLTDLTERKRAEAAVRQFAEVAQSIPIGLLIYQIDDASGETVLRVRSGNRDAVRLLGMPLDEAAGRAVVDVFPSIPEDQLRRYTAVAASGVADDLGEFQYGDDRVAERWWQVLAFPLPERSVGVAFQDVTARKRAEAEVRRLNEELEQRVRERTVELARANAALRAEEALFRGAFETTNVPMVLSDLENRFVRANAAFARLFGYAPGEIAGLGLPDVTYPDDLRESLQRRAALMAGAGDSFHMEKRYRHRDGHTIWGLTNVALARGADGRPLMYVGQVQDITERKAAEERVRERTVALAEANRDLAQKNAENEMFVYSVSHDLRSPLVNLQGFSKELEKGGQALSAALDDAPPDVRDRCRAVLGGKMAKSVGFIQTAVLRLSGIIDALLRLSRAGRVEYRPEVVDVGRTVDQVVGAAQGTVTERGATVRVAELPPAWGDRTAIEQVFGNLLGNALTYLDPARPGVIEVGCLPVGDPAVAAGFRAYFVRDNGLGIAEGHRQKIFQAFQRAHPGVGSGEGLGLAIVARVVDRHRGRVWVESAPGEGSTFYVTLPAAPAFAPKERHG